MVHARSSAGLSPASRATTTTATTTGRIKQEVQAVVEVAVDNRRITRYSPMSL